MHQTAIPMLSYENCPVAIDWLCSTFGFVENRSARYTDESSGHVLHAELQIGEGVVFLATPTPEYRSPRNHARTCADAARWLKCPWVIDGVLVYVDEIDAHFERAKLAGAELLSEIEDGFPGRRYRVADIEGHRWMFMQK